MSVAAISSYIKTHERIIIVLILAGLCWWGYGRYAQIRLDHDNSVLAAQKLVTDQATAASKAQAQQAAQDAAALQALQTKLENQNATLTRTNTTLLSVLADHQHSDSNLPLPDLARRWTALVPSAHPVSSQLGLVVDDVSAHATVSALEQVPTLTSELANETQLKTNDDLLIVQQTKSITDLNSQITGLKTLNADDAKQCTDEKAVMKAQFAKSKRHWFIAGVVVGWIGRQIVKTETGW